MSRLGGISDRQVALLQRITKDHVLCLVAPGFPGGHRQGYCSLGTLCWRLRFVESIDPISCDAAQSLEEVTIFPLHPLSPYCLRLLRQSA